MKYKLNGKTVEPPLESEAVAWFKRMIGFSTNDSIWACPSGEIWMFKTPTYIVLTNPEKTFVGAGKASVIKNAFHIAGAAGVGAQVFVPFTDKVAKEITSLEQPANLRLHFKVDVSS